MMRTPKTYPKFLLLLIFLFLSPMGKAWAMSDAQEIQIGRQVVAEVERQYGVYHDPVWEARIARIGAQIAQHATRHMPYTYKIINMPDENAFAIPGGFIYVTRGILPDFKTDDEIAAVLGHETSHVELKHFQQMYARQSLFNGLAVLTDILTHGAARGIINVASIIDTYVLEPKYSRKQETQADLNGVKLMIQSGYDPNGMIALFQEIEKHGGSHLPTWMQDHPLFSQRIADVRNEIAKYDLIPAQIVQARVIEGEVLAPVAVPAPTASPPAGLPAP